MVDDSWQLIAETLAAGYISSGRLLDIRNTYPKEVAGDRQATKLDGRKFVVFAFKTVAAIAKEVYDTVRRESEGEGGTSNDRYEKRTTICHDKDIRGAGGVR
ncbi:MAG: hypothetical protein Q9163_004149 [Psora crenata]